MDRYCDDMPPDVFHTRGGPPDDDSTADGTASVAPVFPVGGYNGMVLIFCPTINPSAAGGCLLMVSVSLVLEMRWQDDGSPRISEG